MLYRFANFELDTEVRELRLASVPQPVEPQVLDLLVFLLQERHRMVSKDELISAVWQGRFVSDAALSSRIRSARAALGDNGKAQRYIRTVHRKGFRFVGAVEESGQASPQSAIDGNIPSIDRHRDTPTEDATRRPVIAVMPFANLSADNEQGFMANAIAQDISNNLSRYRWLDVVARNATRPYEAQPNTMELVQSELGVGYVVEGSVRRAGDRIRVTTQLVQTTTGRTQWTETYDRVLEDVFVVQDEIVTTLVSRLEPEIGSAERQRVLDMPKRDLQAWEAFHLGIDHFYKFTANDNLEAQKLLQLSRELDPEFGDAHAWWAYAVVLGMVYWDVSISEEVLDSALAATKHALSIDDKNAVFYALAARVQLARREYSSALVENEMAIKLNPSLASAHCGLADTLSYEGRYDEAIERFEHVIDLSTNDPQRWAFYTYGALTMIFSGNHERAVEWCDHALEIPNRQYWTLAHKMVAETYLDRTDAAQHTKAQLLREKPEFTSAFARRKLFFLKRPEQIKTYLDGLAKCGIAEG